MKRLTLTLFCLMAGLLLQAGPLPVERIYVSTDREVYVAGDVVWCALSCLQPDGRFSNESAVSYLELVSTDGTVATAKIGLLDGHGAGSFRIPVTAPTGTYRLLAYTAVNAAEQGTPWLAGSRLLTVFNTTSGARVRDGVDVLDRETYQQQKTPARQPQGSVQLSLKPRLGQNSQALLHLHNPGNAAWISLSVHHQDGLLPAAQENTPESFLQGLEAPLRLKPGAAPVLEYDGEVVTAQVRGPMTLREEGSPATATLSSAGDPSAIYIGQAGQDQRIRFYTANIYGNREIVCEVSSLDRQEGHIELESPFLHPEAGTLPRLQLSEAQQRDLIRRKAALRAQSALRADTLAAFMTHRKDLLLASVPSHRYHLDDYNRFHSVKEIIVEILPELRLKKQGGRAWLELTVTDALRARITSTSQILVMMDGVILSNLDALLDFDALLLEDIDIYDQTFLCGKTPFFGLVNFITRNNYVTALHFPANVRVVDFQGVAYPVAYPGGVPAGEGKDLRQLLYWHPALELEAGSSLQVPIKTPGYPGRFKAIAEGFTKDGTPVYQEFTFEVQ